MYTMLYEMALAFDDTVEFVGHDSGPLEKVGDALIHINTRDTGGVGRRIVVEAKNRLVTMKRKGSFLKELDEAVETVEQIMPSEPSTSPRRPSYAAASGYSMAARSSAASPKRTRTAS